MTGFDPACEYLLHTPHENLYEPLGAERDATRHRCKGCQNIIPRWDRLTHWQHHRKELETQEIRRKLAAQEARQQNLAKARAARREHRAA